MEKDPERPPLQLVVPNRDHLLSDQASRAIETCTLACSQSGVIAGVSQAARKLLGLKDEAAVLGLNVFEMLPPGNASRLARRFRALIEGAAAPEETVTTTLLLPLALGTAVEIESRAVAGPQQPTFELTLRDVTDRERLESLTLRSQRMDMLGQLAGGMLHDLNNVLTAIRSGAELAEGESPERLTAHLHAIDSQAQRAASLIRQLRLFNRGSEGKMVLVQSDEIIAEAATIIQEMFGAKYSINLSLAPDLPEIEAEPTQLYQLIMNLSLNARDAMAPGGTLSLEARRDRLTAETAAELSEAARAGDYLVLSVRDTGKGMTPEVRAKLFEPYFTTKPAGKASGLGLSAVWRIARRHGGFVTVESQFGRGSCFTCYFPAAMSTGQRLT